MVVGALPVLAQEAQTPRPSYSSLINFDALIDNYARLLARKYDLTEEQDTYTQQFLQEKCQSFLGQHRERLFELVDQMFDVRAGADIDQQEMIDWGKRAIPLFQEAKRLIVEGNNEWREILTEEQRQVHNADLELMFESFSTTEDQLGRIVSGNMTVEEFRRGNAGQSPRKTQPRPVHADDIQAAAHATRDPEQDRRAAARDKMQQLRGRNRQQAARSPRDRSTPKTRRPRTAAAPVGEDFEGAWEKYVREFIERYQLAEAQAQKAHSILKDCQEQAQSHMSKRKSQLDTLEKRAKALSGDKAKGKELATVNEQKAKLLEPIGQISSGN